MSDIEEIEVRGGQGQVLLTQKLQKKMRPVPAAPVPSVVPEKSTAVQEEESAEEESEPPPDSWPEDSASSP